MQETYTELEIRILAHEDRGYPIEITVAGQEFPRGYLAADVVPWIGAPSPEEDGQRLFDRLFADRVLERAWAEARGRHAQRRIRLRIDPGAPELHALPWELMRDTTTGGVPHTLAADSDTPFSRYLAGQWSRQGLITTRPIKMLVAIANPGDLEEQCGLPPLDVEREAQLIRDALAGLDEKSVTVRFLPPPVTLDALNGELQKGIHILHYVGHGRHISQEERTVLYMADRENRCQAIDDSEFAGMLTMQGDRLRLIFLASCQTAKISSRAAFRGLAPQIIAAGVPAVLAMQDLVSMEMARQLAGTFYRQLLSHGQVDVALNQARASLIAQKLPDSWGIATLFSRLPDNQLIRFVDLSAEQVSMLDRVATMPRGTAPGAAVTIAASHTLQDTRALQTNVDQMLSLMEEAETEAQGTAQIQAGDTLMTRVELLLSKATLLETEAEQMLQAHVEARLPSLISQVGSGQLDWQAWTQPADTPFKAKLRAGLAQAFQVSLPQVLGHAAFLLAPAQLEQMGAFIIDRLLADFDAGAYQAKLTEAHALVAEASELEPDNVEVSLHTAKLLLALHPDDPIQGQQLLYQVVHRLHDPQDDAARLQLGQALYVQATSQQPPNLDQLRQARDLFVTVGKQDWILQTERDLILALVQKARAQRLDAEQALIAHTQHGMQKLAQSLGNWQLVPPAPTASPYKAQLLVKVREKTRDSFQRTLGTTWPAMHPAQREAVVNAMLNCILADFDDTAFRSKLNEAYTRLQEAARIRSGDGLVLLEQANVLVWLTPGDPGDERAILEQIRQSLRSPRDVTEKSYLAQALFALATLGSQPDAVLLQEARALFRELGFEPWVLACDAILSPPFNPMGQWQIQVGDAFGSVIQVWLQPGGSCAGTQQAGPYGGVVQFAGYWGYDPRNQTLQIQGRAGGVQSFALGITIQGQEGGGYAGLGIDGFRYRLMRVG